MQKTATISVVRVVAHPLYKKMLKREKRYQVHDEVGHKVNEMVNFVACKPYSKTKKWRILENEDKKSKVMSQEIKKDKTIKKTVKSKAVVERKKK